MTKRDSNLVLTVILMIASFILLPIALPAQETQSSAEPTSTGAPQRTGQDSGTGAASTVPSTGTVANPQGSTPTLPGGQPLVTLLGMTLKAAMETFGAPEQVFSVRGRSAWEDDVVFYYPDNSYLFWFRDRVWQVRVDRRFDGKVIGGVSMGDSRGAVEQVLGRPFHVGKDSEIFILADRGFPVRARLFFSDDRLSDLYVYRGDF